MINSRRSQRGVNLVEILVTICILTISLTMGIPAFQTMKLNADRSSALIELIAAVRLARSEAALRGTPVSVCASTDGRACSAAADWSSGWLVFRDADEDLTVEDQAQVLKAVRFEHTDFTITADDNVGGGITFGVFGFSSPTAGSLTYRDQQASRRLALTYVGRLHVTEAAAEPAS
jgi:type IV fimbrial biogenesis protein FimT